MKPRSPGRPGFTMVELLTVIAIIAILAAIIFPVFATVRKNVYKAQCTSNLAAIAQALKLYKDDWKVYPNALFGYYNPEIVDPSNPKKIQTFLYPNYLRDRNVFRCPLSPERSTESETLKPTVHPVTVKDPLDPSKPWRYQYFAWDSYDGSFVPSQLTGRYELHYVRKVTLGLPSFRDSPRQLIYRNPPDNTVVTWCTYHRDYSGGTPAQGSIDLVLFLDGTVKPIPTSEMLATAEDPTRPYSARK